MSTTVVPTMTIGVVSDIHGDLAALNMALERLKQAQVDLIVCAGDLVDFGPDEDEVVARIYELNIPCVQGNHDRLAAERQRLRQGHIENEFRLKALEAITLKLLAQLPSQLRYDWMGCHVLLTHANSWSNDDYIHANSTPPLFRRVVDISKADITILGHTHVPMRIQVGHQLILNPGSVSYNYPSRSGTYAILSLPSRQWCIFDVETGAEIVDFEKRDIPVIRPTSGLQV